MNEVCIVQLSLYSSCYYPVYDLIKRVNKMNQNKYFIINKTCIFILSILVRSDTKKNNEHEHKVSEHTIYFYLTYIRTSVAQTLMACLPRLFRTRS